MELRLPAENRYDLAVGSPVSRADLTADDRHTKINNGFDSLSGRVWLDRGRVKGLYEQGVRVRKTDAAVLLGRSTAPVRDENEESNWSSSSASERITGWRESEKKRGF